MDCDLPGKFCLQKQESLCYSDLCVLTVWWVAGVLISTICLRQLHVRRFALASKGQVSVWMDLHCGMPCSGWPLYHLASRLKCTTKIYYKCKMTLSMKFPQDVIFFFFFFFFYKIQVVTIQLSHWSSLSNSFRIGGYPKLLLWGRLQDKYWSFSSLWIRKSFVHTTAGACVLLYNWSINIKHSPYTWRPLGAENVTPTL